jgi:hypothetical protein
LRALSFSPPRAQLALALLLAALPARAISVYVAPIVYQDGQDPESRNTEQPAAELLKALDGKASGDLLGFSRTSGELPAPRSFLEAMKLCESRDLSYLLYGYIKKSDYAYYAELKLLSRENKELAVTFVSGDDAGHYDRLIEDLAAKIFAYFRDELGLADKAEKAAPRRNAFSVSPALGYWAPGGSEEAKAITGLGSVTAGLRLVPLYPGFVRGSRRYYLSFGLDLEYALGMSAPGYESSFLHIGRARLPIELNCEVSDRSTISVGFAPLFEMDVLAQSRKYSNADVMATATPGASLSLSYMYEINPSFSIALELVADMAAYTTRFLSLSPRVFARFPLGTPLKEAQQ